MRAHGFDEKKGGVVPMKKRRVVVAIVAVGAVCAAVFSAFSNLNRTLLAMAEARAEQRALSQINLAFEEIMHQSFEYADFVSVRTDAQGEISMLEANTILMNRLASDAARLAQERIDELAEEGISLPLGSALGASVLSGKGPRVHFEILPVGTVKTGFVTEFESAGINQTRHKISLEATASVRIVVPSGARTVSVTTTALMAESILVGDVPASYIQVAEVGDALNFAP